MHDYKTFLQEFEEFRVRARHLFEERASAIAGGCPTSSGEWTPAVDVYETADRIVLAAEIAGVRREEMSIEVIGTVITLRGSRSFGREGGGAENYLRMEVPSGSFERSFTLPCPVAEGQIEAVLRDGVLTIRIPRGNLPHGRRIEVEKG